jgi:hypothetical protein
VGETMLLLVFSWFSEPQCYTTLIMSGHDLSRQNNNNILRCAALRSELPWDSAAWVYGTTGREKCRERGINPGSFPVVHHSRQADDMPVWRARSRLTDQRRLKMG